MKVPYWILFIICGLFILAALKVMKVDSEKTELTHERDSIQNHAKELEVQQEILSDRIIEHSETIAMQADIIQNRELETIKEHESKLIILKKYEKLTRIYLVSNAQRDSIRAVLYPAGHHF